MARSCWKFLPRHWRMQWRGRFPFRPLQVPLGLLHDLAWAPKHQRHANVESWICASAALTLLTLYTLLSFCGYFVPPNGVCTPVTHSLRSASSSPSAPLTGASIRRRELARPSVDFTLPGNAIPAMPGSHTRLLVELAVEKRPAFESSSRDVTTPG